MKQYQLKIDELDSKYNEVGNSYQILVKADNLADIVDGLNIDEIGGEDD